MGGFFFTPDLSQHFGGSGGDNPGKYPAPLGVLLKLRWRSWDLPTWVTVESGIVRGLKLILPIIRSISVTCSGCY